MIAYLGLGSNLGDRAVLLESAIAALEAKDARVVARSRIHETKPVGGPPQPDYLNQAIAVEWDGDARSLLAACLDVEASLGRTRDVRFGPRTIDLDILAIEGVTVEEEDLTVPHPRLAERAFALVPLGEIAPGLEIAGKGSVRQLLVALEEEPQVY